MHLLHLHDRAGTFASIYIYNITVIYVTRLLYVIVLRIILVYVMTYVHIVTSDFYDIGHKKSSCCAALSYLYMILLGPCKIQYYSLMRN